MPFPRRRQPGSGLRLRCRLVVRRVARLLFYGFTYGSAFPIQLCSLRALRTDILTFAPLTLLGYRKRICQAVSQRRSFTSGTRRCGQVTANRLARERPHDDLHRPVGGAQEGAKRPLAILVSTKPKRMLVTRTPDGRTAGPGLRNTPTWRFQSPLARKYTTRRGNIGEPVGHVGRVLHRKSLGDVCPSCPARAV